MLNYFIYLIARFIALHLPVKASYKIAVAIADLRSIFTYRDRRIVTENLTAIFPDKPKSEIIQIRREVFRNFAIYLVDFFRIPLLDKEAIRQNIKLENLHYFDQELAKGKGFVLLSAHLGNWELGGALVAFLGYPFWAVALTHKNKKVNDFFNFQRQCKGVKVIPLGKAAKQCLEALKTNQIVALVGDRDFSGRGPVVDFFGKPTCFPEGPVAFSSKLGCSIVPTFMLKNDDGTFTLKIEKPIEFKPSGDKVKDTLDLINRYKIVIEDYVRKHPRQWYMFRRFWIS